ncbi:MAG: hypothetical protein JSR46_09575, partial [Verrucomicrobia bacterium]|nr:hypothetical protein [Verrucomicrobiota bacterium]
PSADGTLFVVPYFPECSYDRPRFPLSFDVPWDDPQFKAEIIRSISSKKSLKTLDLPKNMITVCVHVRRGGGYVGDNKKAFDRLPLKFPPDSYYLEQIQRVSEIFKDQPLYIYIMTDAQRPFSIAQKYAKILNNPNLVFDYRKKGNRHDANVLEDFFSISKFDCAILCQSNFSLMASKLGNYKVLIEPLDCVSEGNEVRVTGTRLTLKGMHNE